MADSYKEARDAIESEIIGWRSVPADPRTMADDIVRELRRRDLLRSGVPKFVQICPGDPAPSSYSNGSHIKLYALDEIGQVWALRDDSVWTRWELCDHSRATVDFSNRF